MVGGQIARAILEAGAEPFLDETSIPKGDNFKKRIHEGIRRCHEFIALFTPWSAKRSWVWVEIGAAWGKGIPVIAVFYGMEPGDLEESGQGKAILEDTNLVELNAFDVYINQLKQRIQGRLS